MTLEEMKRDLEYIISIYREKKSALFNKGFSSLLSCFVKICYIDRYFLERTNIFEILSIIENFEKGEIELEVKTKEFRNEKMNPITGQIFTSGTGEYYEIARLKNSQIISIEPC